LQLEQLSGYQISVRHSTRQYALEEKHDARLSEAPEERLEMPPIFGSVSPSPSKRAITRL
jgi:hypothetical protein